jgi:hypothetical protein
MTTLPATWAVAGPSPGVHAPVLDLLEAVHKLAGVLIIVTAVLIVATAGPRLRSRCFAVVFALALLAVVASGCAAPAAGGAAAAGTTDGVSVFAFATVLAGGLVVAGVRAMFWLVGFAARLLGLVVVGGALAAALMLLSGLG